jgi:hypothetical protein
MDTDVEVLKKLDDLLHLPGFSGFESDKYVPTGIIACEPYNEWAKEQLGWYEGKHFTKPDGFGFDIKCSDLSNIWDYWLFIK